MKPGPPKGYYQGAPTTSIKSKTRVAARKQVSGNENARVKATYSSQKRVCHSYENMRRREDVRTNIWNNADKTSLQPGWSKFPASPKAPTPAQCQNAR